MIRRCPFRRRVCLHPPRTNQHHRHDPVYQQQQQQQNCRRTFAISASERPQRFYWTVDVTTTSAPPDAVTSAAGPTSSRTTTTAEEEESQQHQHHQPPARLAVRSPPASLLRASSLSSLNVVVDVDTWYTVTLDGRPVKTPLGTVVAVPSQLWAYGVAAEWNAVKSRTGVQPSSMPLMTLACTALDRTVQYDECMRYLQTDTVLYWADPTVDRLLYQRQQSAWRDLHQWMNTTFIGAATAASTSTTTTTTAAAATATTTDGDGTTAASSPSPLPLFAHATADEAIRSLKGGLSHDPILTTASRDWLQYGMDAWHGTLVQSAIRETKSFVTGAALVNRVITASTAQTATRVEEEVQIDHWGLVEGQHDYDRLNSSVALHAVSYVAHCLHHDVILPSQKAKSQ
jgi:ATP synthase mitochondrial F1 complex assembly factor 2